MVNYPSATWFEVSGHCMAPLIRKGDFVLARAVDELKIGDIVIISGSPKRVHRVVKLGKGGSVVTKGDLSVIPDPPCIKDTIEGKVTAILRRGRKPVSLEGKLWQIENYVLARYSMAFFLVWDRVAKHGRLAAILRRFAASVSLWIANRS